ncbi:MAG: polysaccharide biosynthesis/export family protein [Pseudolabrys sp.]
MRGARFLLPIVAALAATAFARAQQTYVIDPASGRPVPVVVQQSYAQAPYAPQAYAQPQYAPPQYAQAYQPPAAQPAPSNGHGLFSSQIFAQPQYTPQTDHQFDQPPAPESGRGLLNTQQSAPPIYAQQPAPQVYVQQPAYAQQPPPPVYAQQPAQQMYAPRPVQQPYVLQYTPPQSAAPQYAAPQYAPPQYAPPQYAAPQYVVPYSGGPYAAAPYGYALASPYQQPYTLDAGDKLRVVVFGQDGISNSYIVDAGGNVNLPLVGSVPARGATTQQLSQTIAERLKQGYVREPHVSVEVETYRPFFILGEVTNPGQYPYVADMSAEKAIAIAGGFSPRASKSTVELTRSAPGQSFKGNVPLTYPLRPGDTVVVKERWF